jgi:cytochrome b561
MKWLNTKSEHGAVSRALHWIIVLAIIAQWLLAEADEDSGAIAGLDAMMLHQSIGLTILLLAIVRLAWRLSNPKPAWPADIKPYEIQLARATHFVLYALLLALPLTGWTLSSVEHEPLRFFNGFDVPRIVVAGEDTLEDLHETLFNVLTACAVIHLVGAAKHWIAGRLRPRGTGTTVARSR